MLNDFTRAWTNTTEGKQIQCQVFSNLIKLVQEKKDGLYASVGVRYIRSELENKIDNTNCYIEGVSVVTGRAFKDQLKKTECIMAALQRLEEHGYISINQYSKGLGVKIKKKGYEKWDARK